MNQSKNINDRSQVNTSEISLDVLSSQINDLTLNQSSSSNFGNQVADFNRLSVRLEQPFQETHFDGLMSVPSTSNSLYPVPNATLAENISDDTLALNNCISKLNQKCREKLRKLLRIQTVATEVNIGGLRSLDALEGNSAATFQSETGIDGIEKLYARLFHEYITRRSSLKIVKTVRVRKCHHKKKHRKKSEHGMCCCHHATCLKKYRGKRPNKKVKKRAKKHRYHDEGRFT